MSTHAPGPVYPEPLPYGDDDAPAGRALTASWVQRVGAMLVDTLLPALPWLVVGPYAWITAERTTHPWGATSVQTTHAADWAIFITMLVHLVLWLLNRWVVQGRTGRSWGKRALRLRLVDGRTGGPVGVGRTIGREFAHVLDLPGLIGFLAPLWDPAGRTFADRVVGTVVVQERTVRERTVRERAVVPGA